MKAKNKVILICAVFVTAVAIGFTIFFVSNNFESRATEESSFGNEFVYQTTTSANADAEDVTSSEISVKTITDISPKETATVDETTTGTSQNAEKKSNVSTTKANNQEMSEKVSATTTLQATEKHLPFGTAKDFNVQKVQEDANRYVSTFDGVELDRTLNVNNSCWTLYVSSYDCGSEEKLLARVKETARFQYERCVAGGNLEYDVPLRMNVLAVESYNEKLQVTYYEYYILYFL